MGGCRNRGEDRGGITKEGGKWGFRVVLFRRFEGVIFHVVTWDLLVVETNTAIGFIKLRWG